MSDTGKHKEYIQLLFPYAYNILGLAEDAKDIVQDVLMKHLSQGRSDISDEKNYLIRSVINAAINLKSRQKLMLRAEEVWLPEPIATDETSDKDLHLNDILSYSLLVLMERLNAKERAVFILKETFDYSHTEIAELLTITEENSRQLLKRAKAAIFKPAPKRTEEQSLREQQILSRLMTAIRQRNTQELENTMTADIRFYADGGGKVPLLAKESTGSVDVANLLMTVYHKFLTTASIEFAIINHQAALISYIKGRLNSCQVFDIDPITGAVLRINVILDPDKLKALKSTSK